MNASLSLVPQGGDEPPDLIALHIEHCQERNLRPVYVYNRRNILLGLERVVGALHQASEQDLQAWARGLTSHVAPDARNTLLSHCRMFYRWLQDAGYRSDDPSRRLVRPKRRRHLPRPIDADELRRALDVAYPEVRAMLLLAAYAGFRACEIANLRAQDIDYRTKTLLIVNGKGGGQRVVPLHPDVEAALFAANLPRRGPVFFKGDPAGPYTARSTTQVSPHNVSHRCNKLLHDNGITATLHQLRHFFGTEMYRHSRDLRLVQESLGHASPTTTALYAQWDPSRAAEAVNLIGTS